MITVSLYANPSLKLLLTGDLTLSPEINNIIKLKVQKIHYRYASFLKTIYIKTLATCSS